MDPTVERFLRVRGATEALAALLSPEDQQIQSMEACSPAKWHRAHTTWFFETFVLAPNGVPALRPRWSERFNSYYQAAGPRYARPQRGLLSRPTADEVGAWRREVDQALVEWWSGLSADRRGALEPLIALGLAHEEQHQELLLTDIVHAFSLQPDKPAMRGAPAASGPASEPTELRWIEHPGGPVEIGHAGSGFAFDNEGPRHTAWLAPFALASRCATIGEWCAFADEGGYERPELWLSEGWDLVQNGRIGSVLGLPACGIGGPMHQRREGDAVWVFGPDGERRADPAEPVRHLTFYEADAMARAAGARLPTEAEWETIASDQPPDQGNFREDGRWSPRPAIAGELGLFGDTWEWTGSAYAPYPRYRPAAGALGEYNGKFMVNQIVLRGGSCFTPRGHARATYRNFWPADTAFQLTGVRFARDLA